ncbi:MAG: hypothetical protein R6V86_03320 [Spirochaetia bacterium]
MDSIQLKQLDIILEDKESVSPVAGNLLEDFVFDESLNQIVGSFPID